MIDFGRARVLITGAASGIGRSLAERFAARGATVIVADRDAPGADRVAATIRTAGGQALAIAMDVTSEDEVRLARDTILARLGPPDILVNNAGTVFGGPFSSTPLAHHLRTYRVNTLGMVTVTHTFLPDLISRPVAHLVNMASASGFVGLPFASTYASSKWAVIGFSESIRLELIDLGHRHVNVTTVCPSFVTTGLFDGARPPRLTPALTPERVADLTLRAIERRQRLVLAPWMVKLTPLLRGVLPAVAFDVVARVFGVTTSMVSWTGRPPRD